MRKILYAAAGILLSLSICACGVQQASAPVMTEEKGRAQGYLSADYKETFNYKPLYAASSPYSAVGENLIKNPGFDGESVQKGGGNAVGVWTAQGAFDSAFSITEDGVDGSACLTFNRAQEGRSASYAGYTVDVKPNTTYVLTAKLRSANMSNPMLRVVGVQEGTFISETAAGQDEGFEETSCSFYTGTNTQINIRFMGNAYEYDFRETLSGKAYLDDLCVYEIGGAAAEVVPAKYRMNDSSYHYTKTSGWSAWKWGVSELYWYNNARVFSYNAAAEVYCPDSSYFYVSGRPKAGQTGYFGFEYHWEHKLEKNYSYQFNVIMPFVGENPDFITVNDNIVWTNVNDGIKDRSDSKTITFEYVADKDEYVRIRFICETGIERGKTTGAGRRILPPPYGNWTEQPMTCYRTATIARPDYVKYDLHEKTEFVLCDAEDTALMLRPEVDAPIDASKIEAAPKVDYKTSDVVILDEADVRYDGVGNVLKSLGVNSVVYAPTTSRGNHNFEEWAKQAIDAGAKNLGVYTVLPNEYLSKSGKEGEYVFTQLVNMLGSEEELELGLSATAEVANKWLEMVPDGTASIILCELESHFGFWNNGIENTNLAKFPGYEKMSEGGLTAYDLAYKFLEDVHTRIDSKLSKPDKVNFISNSSRGAFDLNNIAVEGCDVIVGKGTHRCNLNIVTSITRGAAAAKGIEWGLVWDTFDRDYHYGITNEAVVAGFLSMFHSGVDIIISECDVTNDTEKTLSHQAEGWFDGVRYVKTHPQAGDPVVKIGILRGEGDEWAKLAAKSAAWEQSDKINSTEMTKAFQSVNVLSKWAEAARVFRTGKQVTADDTYLGDFGLLDVIYSNFGTATRTDMQRQLTGTPYGPANILRDSISLEEMNKYDTLIYCGRGQTITAETVKNLETYVKNGGTLFIAAGQLKDQNGDLVVDSFAGVKLNKSKIVDGLPYYYLESDNAKLIKRHKNGDPQALMVGFGEGSVAFFSGEYLSAYDNDVVRETLVSVLGEKANVTFQKDAKYIEYTPSRKGQSVVFPFINQGRGLFPSGNGKDYGVWSGNVAVDLGAYGLKADNVEIYRVNQSIDGTKPITLSPVKFKTEDNTAVFAIDVSIIDEIVIGPKGQVEKDFFN